LGVAYVMRVGSGWRRGQCSGRYEPTAVALACEPDVLGASSLPVRAPFGC
jgi:hypothetical protein